MRLLDIRGRLINKNVDKYRINWDKPSLSKFQFEIKQFLKIYWSNHIVYEEFPVFGTRLKVDIINFTRKIAVEVHGPQHHNFNKFFHDNSRLKYLEGYKRDAKKIQWLELNNIKLVEIFNEDRKHLSLEFIEKTFQINIV